jgi:hypothetical protein
MQIVLTLADRVADSEMGLELRELHSPAMGHGLYE